MDQGRDEAVRQAPGCPRGVSQRQRPRSRRSVRRQACQFARCADARPAPQPRDLRSVHERRRARGRRRATVLAARRYDVQGHGRAETRRANDQPVDRERLADRRSADVAQDGRRRRQIRTRRAQPARAAVRREESRRRGRNRNRHPLHVRLHPPPPANRGRTGELQDPDEQEHRRCGTRDGREVYAVRRAALARSRDAI
jgi:hypothetical protein